MDDPGRLDPARRYSTTTQLAPGDDGACALPIGSTLGGRYLIEDVRGGSGKSGMGVVYIVREGERQLAVKTFQRRFAQDLGFIIRFIRETSAWIRCGYHPNLVAAFHVDIIEAFPYLFMEYVPSGIQGGHSLADHLGRGRMTIPKALSIAVQMCDAMTHATAAVPGLVHRDIKPENVLLTPEGVAKVTDFGLVRAPSVPEESLQRLAAAVGRDALDTSLTLAGAVLGTPAYMAPEQFESADSVGSAADIYATGCVLYEMLCGFQPFSVRADSTIERVIKLRRLHRDETPIPLTDRLDDCPRSIERIVNRCLHKDPARRWRDFAEFAEALREAGAQYPGEVGPPLPARDPTAREVAAQSRSLTLLEGYDRAVRLRQLRWHQEDSPYAFHLALASYFRTQGDSVEEMRQLQKALCAPRVDLGYEAVFHLSQRYLELGILDEAADLIDGFVQDSPARLEHVLEPWVQLQLARGNFAAVEQHLEKMGEEDARVPALRVALLRACGDDDALEAWASAEVERLLDALCAKIGSLQPDHRVGLDTAQDLEFVAAILGFLRPEADVCRLQVVDHATWPDLTGYPDFAPDLALLSEALGLRAELGARRGAPNEPHHSLAIMLDYPRRMQRHSARDEHWFWAQEPPVLQS